jgi:uncharacterized protein YhhL (DUF1145 family)
MQGGTSSSLLSSHFVVGILVGNNFLVNLFNPLPDDVLFFLVVVVALLLVLQCFIAIFTIACFQKKENEMSTSDFAHYSCLNIDFFPYPPLNDTNGPSIECVLSSMVGK